MRTVGIIVEYNPLHNGHVYHCQQAKNLSGADAVIAVMSGHFLQRGEPALVNKWSRTEMALHMGADVVIELPVAYASQPAEWFAYGAVSALHASGVVDSLCFGSESGDIGWLSRLADLLADEPERFQQLLANRLKQGLNYPTAYSQAIQDYATTHHADILVGRPDGLDTVAKPNDTLGLHYLIALRRMDSRITPYTVTRTKAGYHDRETSDHHIASATAIRRLLLGEGDLTAASSFVPAYTSAILRREMEAGRAPIHWELLKGQLFHALFNRSGAELATLSEVTEGLENRMLRMLAQMKGEWSVDQFIELCKTKRYTRTKLQRTMTRILLGHRQDMLSRDVLNRGVPYLRVLGFSRTGQELLKRMRRTSAVPIITNVGKDVHPLLALDIRATQVYALAYRSYSSQDVLRDYYEPPICHT